MAVTVFASDPEGLLRAIVAAIQGGRIRTWSCDADGDFTHTAGQWRRQAWLRPKSRADQLVFGILPPKGSTLTKVVYGVFHGRFVEMLLTHFDERFSRVTASALPTDDDVV